MGTEKSTLKVDLPQRNKETEWNSQPLRSPLLFQNKSQKPGQKALKR